MSSNNNQLSFTWADVERWLEDGIISSQQAKLIRSRTDTTEVIASPRQSAHRQGETQDEQPGVERVVTAPPPTSAVVQPLDVVKIAYYFGGSLILLAYIYLVSTNWQHLGKVGQFAVCAFTVAAIGYIGVLLRRLGVVLGGNVLVFVATCLAPLVFYTFAVMAKLWPQSSGLYDEFVAYQLAARPNWVALELFSLSVALIVIWLIRFPLLTMPISFWGWYLTLDLARLVTHHYRLDDGNFAQWVSIVFGLLLLLLGYLLQRRSEKDCSDWFYLLGHLALLTSTLILIFGDEVIAGLLFLVMYIGFLLAGVWLQRRVFLAFSGLYISIYI